MNLKETIISSFFGHLILFLLLIAAMNYTTGPSWSRQKIMPVDLLSALADDDSLPLSPSDEPPPVTSQNEDEADMPGQSDDNMNEQPADEKDPETAAQPEKQEKQEGPSIQREGFNSPEAYYQFIMIHKQIYGRHAGRRVNEILTGAFKTNKRQFYGGSAIVSLRFSNDGRLTEVRVDSTSPDLKAFFEETVWDLIPAPMQYSLGYILVRMEFVVQEGYMSFNIDTL